MALVIGDYKMTIKLSSKGGGGLPKLAPDLTWPSSLSASLGFVRVTGIDPSAGLTTALSLTGKHSINYIALTSLTVENITIKLTIDDLIVWDDSYVSAGANLYIFGSKGAANSMVSESIKCDTSFLLEVQTASDNNITLEYLARPIL